MKFAKIILPLLCILLCADLQAASKKTSKKKAQKEPVEVVDTLRIDTFSYYYGRANTNGLREYLVQRMGVDTAYIEDFLRGFQRIEFSEADRREKARLAGIEIRKQLEEQIFPSSNKQVNDSVNLLNKGLFVSGFEQGIQNATPSISMDSIQALVQKQLNYYTRVNNERKFASNKKAGEDFLKENAKRDSVVTTESGLQYKVITMGTGPKPTTEDKVKVNYEGRLVDGTVFDSSYTRNRPAQFPVNQVIKGWIEALTLMPVGSKWEVYVSQELAYAEREQGNIPPFSCLIFTVELLEIVK